MANKKITELNEATGISATDWLVMVDVANDETKKIHPNLVGASIPVQDTAPQNPEDDDLWIDTSEPEEMQEAIKNEYSTSTADTYSCDYVNKISNYSATEQVVGKWVDGKPVYRKVISGVTETAGTFDVETISTNIKQVIKVDGFVVSGTTNLPIAYSNTGAPIFYFVDGNNLNIQVGNASFAGKSWYATIEYLKTTD